MSNPEQEQTVEQKLSEARDVVIKRSRELVSRLIEIEQDDADLKSVIAIAAAHGYRFKSQLWVAQSRPLAEALEEYNKLLASNNLPNSPTIK